MRGPARTPLPICLLAALAAACLLAPAARAEVPSVDAYGGEALVLGSAHHHDRGKGSGNGTGHRGATGGSVGKGSGAATTAGSSSSTGSAPGSQAGSSGGSHASGGGGSSNAASGATGGNSENAGGGGAATGASGSQPTSFASHQPASSSAFGTTDVVLLIAGVLGLAALALVLRTARKPG